MPFDLQTAIAGHSAYFHGTETVVHEPRNPTREDVTGLRGHRGAVDQERLSLISGTLGVEQCSAIWEVWGDAVAWKNGDYLRQADGSRHLVQAARHDRHTSRHELATIEAGTEG
jgi:hypothetical protein